MITEEKYGDLVIDEDGAITGTERFNYLGVAAGDATTQEEIRSRLREIKKCYGNSAKYRTL